MSGSRSILVCEDNPALSRIIGFTLERAGFSVTRMDNGQAGWRAAQTDNYCLIVTDYQMPTMSGPELVAQLRMLPQYETTPVLMLTAKKYEVDADALRKDLGIAQVIPKPFSPSQLVAAVEAQLAASA